MLLLPLILLQPLLFFLGGLLFLSSEAKSESRGCLSTEGQPCAFPFFHEGILHSECALINGEEQCSVNTSANFDALELKACSQACLTAADKGCLSRVRHERCIFPFMYQGRTYQWCTMADHDAFWCATKVEESQEMAEWDLCGQNCPGLDEEENTASCRTESHKVCQFPFIWKGHVYKSCSLDGHLVPWCATSVDQYGILKTWDNCSQTCEGYFTTLQQGCRTQMSQWMCKFPFVFKGREYKACTSVGHSKGLQWCSISNFANGSVKAWDYCSSDCPGYNHEELEYDALEDQSQVLLLTFLILSLAVNLALALAWIIARNREEIRKLRLHLQMIRVGNSL